MSKVRTKVSQQIDEFKPNEIQKYTLVQGDVLLKT